MELQPPIPAEIKPGEPLSARLSLNSFRQIIFQPGLAFAGLVAQEKRQSWPAPVLFVAVLVVIAALISSQVTSTTSSQRGATGTNRTTTTQATRTSSGTTGNNRANQGGQGGAFPGGDFVVPKGAIPGVAFPGGTTTSEQTSAAAAAASPNIWLATLMPLASFIITWALLGALTNLLSLAFGGQGNSLMAMNIAAWASIPLGARAIMQIVYYLATGSAISQPGLSGFAPAAAGNTGLAFLQHLLSRVDLYLFWQIGLLAAGVGLWGGLARKKSWAIAILAVGILILLQSLLGLGLEALGGLNLNTSLLLRMR